QNSITLNRYSDKKWSQLPVKCLNEDQKYLYFTAQTPEFSYFAITGKAIAKQNVAETKPTTKTSDLKQNNTTTSDTESKQKPEQKSDNGNLTSIPGFEAISVVACILTVLLLYKRK
ncbi:MAG TPA: PGF-pre-PGF domain-containing protein, partial [Methanosarcina sp.]